MSNTNNLPDAIEGALAELLHAQLLLGVATARRRPTADAPEVLAASTALVAVCDAVRAALAQPDAPVAPAEPAEALRIAGLALIGLAEHDQHCEVFNLDDEGRHCACSCGLTDAIATITAAGKAPAEPASEPLKGWTLNHAQKGPEKGTAQIGYMDPEDDRFAPIVTVDTGLYYQPEQALPLAVAILGALADRPQPAPARVPLTDDPWHKLYRRAINEANGLTNYVEDRPELRSAERRLSAIEAEARTLAAAGITPAKEAPHG